MTKRARDYKQKCEEISRLLTQEYLKHQQRTGRLISQREYARYLGIPVSTFNEIFNGRRPPQGENLHIIADAIGPIVYDILDEPRRMPTGDVVLDFVASNWHLLDDESKERIQQVASAGMEELANQ